MVFIEEFLFTATISVLLRVLPSGFCLFSSVCLFVGSYCIQSNVNGVTLLGFSYAQWLGLSSVVCIQFRVNEFLALLIFLLKFFDGGGTLIVTVMEETVKMRILVSDSCQ